MSEQKSTSTGGFTIFAVGALIGAGVALLYAPQSGKETRKMLAKKGKQLRARAQDTIENAQEFIHDGKEKITTMIDQGKELVHHEAKHKRA